MAAKAMTMSMMRRRRLKRLLSSGSAMVSIQSCIEYTNVSGTVAA
jgi:hypothetical protein